MLRTNPSVNTSICQSTARHLNSVESLFANGNFFRAYMRIQNSSPNEFRGERMPERSMRYSSDITNVGEQNCTRLHPSRCILLGWERKRDRVEAEEAHRAEGRHVRQTEANFRLRFIRRRMDGARFPSSRFSERDDFLPTAKRRWRFEKCHLEKEYLPVRCILHQCHFFHCPGSTRYSPYFYKSAV